MEPNTAKVRQAVGNKVHLSNYYPPSAMPTTEGAVTYHVLITGLGVRTCTSLCDATSKPASHRPNSRTSIHRGQQCSPYITR